MKNDKDDDLDSSIAIVLGKAGKAKPKDELVEDEGDAGLETIGRSLCEAIEKKDYAAIGRALADANEYCQPEEPSKE